MPTASPSPTVSVVIPTGGRSVHLVEIVERLLHDAVHEVLVVDDRPDPPAPPALPGDPRVQTIPSGGRGPAAARQAGTDRADGEVVLLLDDDVVPEPGLVRGHAARHAAGARLVVVGAMPVDLASPIAEPAFPRELYARDYARRTAAYERDAADVLAHLWAGNVSLRRDDALLVGLVSAGYAGYRHEDRDFGLRCRAAGLQGVYAPELAAVHRYVRSPAAFFADARAQGAEQALLRRLHPETAAPDAFLDGLPPGLRQTVALARRRRGAAVLRRVLAAAGALAERAGAPAIVLRAAQIRRRVEQIDGASRPGMGQ